MEQDVRVAGGTADNETGLLLVIKRCLYHIAYYNWECSNISLFHSSAAFYIFICNVS